MAEILQYKRIDGVFHRMNALTKICFLLVVIVLAILSTDPLVLAGLILLVFSLALVGRFGRELLAQVPMLIFLSAGLILLTVLTMQSGDVIGYLIPAAVPVIGGHIPVTTGALHFAAVLSLRFFVMLFTFQLMIISTQPRDLITALRRLHLPVDYALMLLIAIRFIPSLQLEGRRIQEAQQARAYNPGAGVKGKVRALTPIIIPLVSNALGKANVLGLTIDLRGLRTMSRTPGLDRPFGRPDYLLAVLIVALVIAGAAVTLG
ncbi:energy-coupling factor transporter transmembrane protein EcfT [Methanogenium sp. MK-MG]|uniref:energy-coupling factor transporter transmembrane component T family protein n=1 Tax=Methanogenium sp. MK-MG TaxID=2599926 RepID=UPI0013EB27C0|nr:energy-coupling factor transporter transmembrane component T [Methanogenium sp. MK-MG]KAF1078706.1 Energy-coupling factor transporter transmembrane protein EcfT [Methanogenium sp. MK-MG]